MHSHISKGCSCYIPGNCFNTFELFFAFLDTIHQLIPCLRESWNIKGSVVFDCAEFNLVHKCANKYSDEILGQAVVYTSCAPCERCLAAIASLGVHQIVCGVSYREFCKLLPFDYRAVDREGLLRQLGIQMTLTESVLEEEGMHVFEWWGGEYRPLEELFAVTFMRVSPLKSTS